MSAFPTYFLPYWRNSRKVLKSCLSIKEVIMRQLLICFVVLTVLVSLPLTTALAEREVTIKPVDPVPSIISMGEQAIGDPCLTGNLNGSAWAIGDWALPPEEYKLTFDPLTAGTCFDICAPLPGRGIDVNTIHMHLQVDAACTIVMGVDVEEVIYPTSPDCPEPGPVVCVSPLYQVDLPQAGGWILNIPIECVCLTFGRKYMLSVYFESATGNIDLVTDNFPSNCTSWNNWGEGWNDLVTEYGFPGNLRIWADATCCEPPVPVELKSWGNIKSIYKQ
jgi:hypothetical protein